MNTPYPFRLSFFEKATHGKRIGHDQTFTNISIDSRNINSESLFVAIEGEIFDGHDFIWDVLQKGIKGIVVQKDHPILSKIQASNVSQLHVDDTVYALGEMAKAYKKCMNVNTVAVTGSAGKTSTRELIALVLQEKFSVLTPQKNFNNEIGVPLTLFNLRTSHEWAVLELGMSAPDEIARLTDICQPDIGIITNIGPAHLAGVGGTLDGVLSAKTELFSHMGENKTAIVNIDDERLLNYLPSLRQKKITCGLTPTADMTAKNIHIEKGKLIFEMVSQKFSAQIKMNTFNHCMIFNALAAGIVGVEAGMNPKEIKMGLESFSPIQGRMMPIDTKKGILVIDDTYNANPSSMRAALDSLKDLPHLRKIAVLGDMGELGDESKNLHRDIGKKVAQLKIDRLYIIGEFAQDVMAGAIKEVFLEKDIRIGNYDDIISDLITYAKNNDAVLVKGSRFMQMEKIVLPLVEWANRK